MRIPFQQIVNLLSKKLTVQSLSEFIKENSDELNASLTTAQVIEDYEYLSVMTQEGDKYKDFVMIYFPTVAAYPVILKKDQPLSLMGIAKLFFDFKRHFADEDFYDIIEKEGEVQSMEPTSLCLQFDLYLAKIISIDKLKRGDVGRNELCPCGSGRKYKQCHGNVIKEIGSIKDQKEAEQ